MCLANAIINVLVFLTVVQAGFVNVVTREDEITRDTAVAHDVFVNNGSIYNIIENPSEDKTLPAYSIVLKFFSLIIGAVAVFTLVQVLMHCCHDNKNISFQRIRKEQPTPYAIFMRSFSKDADPDTKYKSFEYIDVETPNNIKETPMMSPTTKSEFGPTD